MQNSNLWRKMQDNVSTVRCPVTIPKKALISTWFNSLGLIEKTCLLESQMKIVIPNWKHKIKPNTNRRNQLSSEEFRVSLNIVLQYFVI